MQNITEKLDYDFITKVIQLWIISEDLPTSKDGIKEYTGIQKAAILCIILGKETAGEVFKRLSQKHVEMITWEIARIDVVLAETNNSIIQEVMTYVDKKDFLFTGGIHYAKDVLEQSLGVDKSIDIINRLTPSLQLRPFDFVHKCDPAHLLNFIQQEHPQTIAVILSYLEPNKAAAILQNLPYEVQSDVTRRIACMDRISPEILREVERVLEKKLATISNEDYMNVGGVESVVEILNMIDHKTEKQIIEILEDDDPELAEEIKKRMLIFEDIIMLSDRDIQKVMREVDSQELAKALKDVDVEVQDKIFRNMSKRASDMLKEDMEYMGPIRKRDIEEAQEKIVTIIRKLEESSEIILCRPGEDELIGEEKKPKKNITFYKFITNLTDIQILELHNNIDLNFIIKALIHVEPCIVYKLLRSLSIRKALQFKWWLYKARKRCYDLNDMINAQEEIMNYDFKEENNE